jgi:hypothetical protein
MNKAKAAGVSASSFFDLKAELFKQENEFSKNKAAGKSTIIIGGVKRPDKVTLDIPTQLHFSDNDLRQTSSEADCLGSSK